jgi:hypothetical protein
MKRIIICEGKTDAILIGYFLAQTCGLVYALKGGLHLQIDKTDQLITWFKNQIESAPDIAIFSAGGFDRVGNAIRKIVDRNKFERDDMLRFRRLLVVVDVDDAGIQSRIDQYKTWLDDAGLSLHGEITQQPTAWHSWQYPINSVTPKKIETIESTLFVVPEDSNGSLETYLLNSLLDESDEQQKVVTAARDFIRGLGDISFIKPRRFKEKACLGSTLSVFSPDWVFTQIDEKLKSVTWDKFQGTGGLRRILFDLCK